jgi:hypothetical protein
LVAVVLGAVVMAANVASASAAADLSNWSCQLDLPSVNWGGTSNGLAKCIDAHRDGVHTYDATVTIEDFAETYNSCALDNGFTAHGSLTISTPDADRVDAVTITGDPGDTTGKVRLASGASGPVKIETKRHAFACADPVSLSGSFATEGTATGQPSDGAEKISVPRLVGTTAVGIHKSATDNLTGLTTVLEPLPSSDYETCGGWPSAWWTPSSVPMTYEPDADFDLYCSHEKAWFTVTCDVQVYDTTLGVDLTTRDDSMSLADYEECYQADKPTTGSNRLVGWNYTMRVSFTVEIHPYDASQPLEWGSYDHDHCTVSGALAACTYEIGSDVDHRIYARISNAP